jgi:hypothetical protein
LALAPALLEVMEYSPPPLFKQGAPARVKVTVFALISIALLVVDARFHALTAVRQVAATVLYPLQMAAWCRATPWSTWAAISRRFPRCRRKSTS